ncbi:MAG TPA: M48 family metalloprotease [Solirubrobacterales bacterium]|nr:M48 family metalloprotease [Solirubrobacterales bacterium]
MTRPSRETVAMAAVIAIVAAAWAWGVHALWNSAPLPSLDLPHLDPHEYFSASFLDRSASYERFLTVLSLLATVTLVAVLALYARHGAKLARESAAGRVGTGLLLAMLGFAVVWLAEVPFDLAALWWQRRHNVAHQGYLTHLLNSFFTLGSEFVFVSLGFAVMMGLAGALRRWWWLVAVPAFAALALAFTFVTPYLVPDTSPLQNPRLVSEARALERIEGAPEARLRVQEVRKFTTAPNAMSTGVGPSRTVFLWDTLLHDGFSPAEVRLVLAHEIGHLAHDDPLKRIGWIAIYLLPVLGLLALLTRRRGGLARPEAVPLALLILIVAQLIATPLLNSAYRREEAAADWAALEATREPATDRAVMKKLAEKSLANPDPSGVVSTLFEDHPTIMERIALARAWEEQHEDATR